MKKLSVFLLSIALFALASTRMALVSVQAGTPAQIGSAHAADAAFRDGLFFGQRDAATGAPQHVSVGRWAFPNDRNLFRQGYEIGYRQVSASRIAR